MRRASLCVCVLLLGGVAVGCGGHATPSPDPVAATSGDEVAIAAAARCDDDDARDARVRELESRLAMSSAEIRSLRTQLRDAHERADVVQPATAPDVTTLPGGDDEEEDTGARPVLRLYGAQTSDTVAIGEPPSFSVPTAQLARLPVVMTPGAPESVPAIPIEPVAVAPPPDDAIVTEYRAALAHVSAREWDAALASLGSFVTAHPDHAYADNAMYWRGEVLYARRDYAGAITELTAMIERFPRGNKVPDALLRIGFAYERLGQSERARDVFRRVREEYPGTVAARTASREDV